MSVLLPTLDRPADLDRFLGSLLRQTRLPDELVVVDAGLHPVEDPLRRRLAGSGIALVYARARPGTASQRNEAIERSRGEFLFFLDDDVILEPDYVERSLAAFDLPFSPPVGAVMGTCTNPPASPAVERYKRCFGITHDTSGSDPRLYVAGDVRWLARPPAPVAVPAVATGRVAYRRSALREHRFTPFLSGYAYGEDVELAVRVGRAWTLVQTPEARLYHARSAVARDAFAERAARIVYARWWFFRRHREPTPANLLAFAWTQLGTAPWLLAVGVRQGVGAATARGIARGVWWGLRGLSPGSPRGTPSGPT